MPVPPPGAHERDDSFAIRSPHGRRGLILIRGDRYSAGPPKSPRKWRQCRCSQAPGAARSHSDPRRTSRRWATQKPRRAAAVSHFAAPPGTSKSHYDVRVTSLRWTSQEPTNVTSVSQFAAPRGGEASFCIACGTTPLDLPGAPKIGDSFAAADPREGDASF